MHDRGDFQSGWEIDIEWNKKQKEKARQRALDSLEAENRGDQVEEEDVGPNLECPLCHKEFKDPVLSRCDHVFCESCALKNPKRCRVCDKPTGGTFAVAKLQRAQLLEKKRKIADREAEIRAATGNPLQDADGD